MKRLLLFVLMVAFGTPAFAQRAPMPWPRVRFMKAGGTPLAGGRLWSYVAGTTTPLVTYQDYAGIEQNTNPVILDSEGYADVWLTARSYKFILEDATCQYHDVYGYCHGNLQWTVDNIADWGLIALSGLMTIDGDVSGTSGATVVESIQGVGVSSTAPTTGKVLTYDGAQWAAATHNVLSATHTDATAATAVRGDIITAQGSSPKWTRLAKGTQGQALIMGANEPAWGSAGLSTTTTLDFGATGSGTSSDLTITVTGAAVGDTVLLALPASPNANTCFTAWVSATDTVKVRFNNYSSGSVDPALATYKVTVFK